MNLLQFLSFSPFLFPLSPLCYCTLFYDISQTLSPFTYDSQPQGFLLFFSSHTALHSLTLPCIAQWLPLTVTIFFLTCWAHTFFISDYYLHAFLLYTCLPFTFHLWSYLLLPCVCQDFYICFTCFYHVSLYYISS